jgi:hypothetical protein
MSRHLELDEKIYGGEHVEYTAGSSPTESSDHVDNPAGIDEKKLLRKT